MIDREKLVIAIERAKEQSEEYGLDRILIDFKAVDMILELLKDQEAKEVKVSTNMYTGLPITHCPKCGVSLDRYLYGRQCFGQINYCPICGQAVKWDD